MVFLGFLKFGENKFDGEIARQKMEVFEVLPCEIWRPIGEILKILRGFCGWFYVLICGLFRLLKKVAFGASCVDFLQALWYNFFT